MPEKERVRTVHIPAANETQPAQGFIKMVNEGTVYFQPEDSNFTVMFRAVLYN